jgi:hypothetical protein
MTEQLDDLLAGLEVMLSEDILDRREALADGVDHLRRLARTCGGALSPPSGLV